ncbi:MAG: hypothetical protein ACLQDY_03965 [Streptosporangiaceae bacterium]
MAEPAQFIIGTPVSCSDGPCGEVRRIIVNPAAGRVTHLAVQPEHRHDPARLVPLDLVVEAGPAIVLRCTQAEFGDLELADETDLVDESGYSGDYDPADVVGGYGYAASLTGGAYVAGAGIGYHPRAVTRDAVPEGETEIRHGDRVHATDGEIGRVEGLIVGSDGQRVTHVLLQEGHLWGRKEVAIPVSAVLGVDDGIRLSLTKKQVEELPAR